MVEDAEESVCQGRVSESLESQGLEDGQGLVEFVHGEVAVLRTVTKGFFDELQHLLGLLLTAASLLRLLGGVVWI